MGIVLVALVCILLVILYLLSTWKFNYWKKKKVIHLKPAPLFGNYVDFILQRRTWGEVAQRICQEFPSEPYIGTYYGTEPALLVQDLELIKLITTRDYPYFSGREISKHTDREIFTRSMFFTYGNRWKVIRQNMTPLFSSAKLKKMFHVIEKCAHMFEDLLERETGESGVIEARALMARYTMDSICACGFGVETKTMEPEYDRNPFTKIGHMIFDNSVTRGVAIVIRGMWPVIFYGLGYSLFSKEVTDFFHNLLIGVFETRDYKPTKRHDFVDLVLNLRQNDFITCDSILDPDRKVTLKLDTEFLVAQCVMFFAAGYETSASTLSFALYELAKDEAAQSKVIEEVDEYLLRCKGKISYECVTELPYLDACVHETMRLYPILGVLHRELMEDYTFPDGLKVEKGLRVHMPLYHLHRNPEYFPEPEQFRPERFVPDAKHLIKPYTYMPFGEGSRLCIGTRVGKMQMLPALMAVFKSYRVELADSTPRTLKLNPRAMVTQSLEKLNLKLVRRDGWQQRMFTK